MITKIFREARMAHVVAFFFGCAAVILILGSRIAPHLFPPPDWVKKNFAVHSAKTEVAKSVLEKIAALSSADEYEKFCGRQPHKWAIMDGTTTIFDCLGGIKLPPEERLTTIALDIPHMTLSFANHPHRPDPLFGSPHEPPKFDDDRRDFRPPPPHRPDQGPFLDHGRPPFHQFPALFRLQQGRQTIALLMPWGEPPAFGTLSDRPTLFMGGVALTLLLGLLVLLQRMLTPLPAIEKALEEYSRGNFRFRPTIKGAREFRRLGTVIGEMAEQLERHLENKNRLLIDVSHELKTPLARLRVHTALAKDDPSAVEDIEKDVIAMTSLVERILDNARAAYSQGKIETRHTNISQIIERICQLAYERAHAHGTELSFERNTLLSQETWSIPGDENQLHTAIENVVDNALKYCATDAGKVRVALSSNATHVLIRVTNNGKTIAEPHKKLIFEPFYRVDESRTRSTGGHGLGLSISQRIIAAHQGTLVLEQSDEQGTTFLFSLPKYARA